MTEPEHRLCREWLSKDRGDCGKPATHRVRLIDGPSYYKCQRHARKLMRNEKLASHFIIEELT